LKIFQFIGSNPSFFAKHLFGSESLKEAFNNSTNNNNNNICNNTNTTKAIRIRYANLKQGYFADLYGENGQPIYPSPIYRKLFFAGEIWTHIKLDEALCDMCLKQANITEHDETYKTL
jgi:hypothetical protein